MSNLFHARLIGYSRKDVNAYISRLNEEFSQKLLEKELEKKEELRALQEENERLKKENEELQALRQEVADALISAREYASGIRRKAEEDDRETRSGNAVRQEAEARRIQSVGAHIDGVQRKLRSVLERMDRELESYAEEVRRMEQELAAKNVCQDPEEAWNGEELCVREDS